MSFLIKNANVVDGTGGLPHQADILIQSGRILAVGGLSDYRADEYLDAAGAFATPGFIDLVSYADLVSSPFNDYRQEDYLKQGITTVVIGHSGQSLAPIFGQSTEHNRDWGLWSDFMRSTSRSRFGINFLSFVGCHNLFHADERVSLALLNDSLGNGAVGISFGGTKYPGFSGHLIHLAESAASRGRLIAATLPLFLPAKERERLLLSLLQAKRRGEYGSSSGHASSRLVVSGVSLNDIDYLKRSRSLREVIIGYNPYGLRLIPISSFLPRAQSRDLPSLEKSLRRANPSAIFIINSSSLSPRHESLSSFSRRARLSPAAALLRISKNNPHTLLAVNTYSSPNWSPLKEQSVFLSALISSGPVHPFREFINLGLLNSSWSLPKVINRLSAAPAAALGIGGDRGIISPGRRADINLIGQEGDIKTTIVGGVVSFSTRAHSRLHPALAGALSHVDL